MRKSSVFLLPSLLLLAVTSLDAQSFRSESESARVLSGFGAWVAVGDGEIFVAEPLSSDRAGMIFVYRRDADGAWAEQGRLMASDASVSDRFGRSFAVEGNSMFVGATSVDSTTGAVYLFQKNSSGTWHEVQRFDIPELSPGDAIGRMTAIDGDWAAVSALGYNESAGAVFVFKREGDSWSQHSIIAGDDLAADDFFGLSLAIAGDRIMAGTPRHNGRAGATYSFRYEAASDAWIQEAKLVGDGVEANNQFGSAIVLDGDRAFVSAPLFNSFTGAIFTFEFDPEAGEWTEQGRITPFDGQRNYRFGSSMASNESGMWIGAPGASRFAGRVYSMTRSVEGEWSSAVKMSDSQGAARDFFGGQIALGEDVGVVGVSGDDYGEGTAVIFERDAAGAWHEAAKVLNDASSMDAIVGGEVPCADGAAAQFDCAQIDIIAFMPVSSIGGSRGVSVNDIWGWTDPSTGKEYALVGRVDGTSFVDISDPGNPMFLGSLPRTEGSPGSTWRDIKVYQNHAFIVADGAGAHGMQVFDLTQLRDVRGAPATFTETAHYDGIASAHNIVINEETGYAFSVGSSSGGETCGGGLHMINIQDPMNPTFAGCFADPNTGRRNTGYTHDAQCVIYNGPDTDHQGKEICFGANETALSIADVSDKEAPVALSMVSYPNVGYTHQGWLTEDQRYFFMNDELDEMRGLVSGTRTLIWDVSDLDDPVLAKEHFGTQPSIDHNLYIKGHFMYQSNYMSGLRILDISDVENPVEVGYLDTVPYGDNSPSFGGSWSNYPYFESGVIIVTSMREGLFVLKKRKTQAIP